MDIPWLSPSDIEFPAPETALDHPNGLLAIGGDLSPKRLVEAYRQGIFPWFEEPDPILWWSPAPRTILFPDKAHVSRSLKKRIRRKDFEISYNQCFDRVIRQCATVPRQGQHGTWIGEQMLSAYNELYRQGIAHSIEIWKDDSLVGGLYGIAIGGVFFGESMFSLLPDASKVAFVFLADKLLAEGFGLIDCQVSNPHLFTLGAEEIDRKQFMALLKQHIDRPVKAF